MAEVERVDGGSVLRLVVSARFMASKGNIIEGANGEDEAGSRFGI